MSRNNFKGKRIAVIGLGPHGEMLADIQFLIRSGAIVAVYDMRSEARVKNHIVFLRSVGLISYCCGSVPPEDLLDMDLIILSEEYPRTSSFLLPAQENNVPIEYPETLFFKLAPAVTVIAIIGTVGKSTVLSILQPMLQLVIDQNKDQQLFVINPESEEGILVHLSKIRSNDIVLVRVEESMLIELHKVRMSPHVAIITTVPSSGTYISSPFEILSYQTYNNFIIAKDSIIDTIHSSGFHARAKMFRTKNSTIPASWEYSGKGSHDRENASLALEAAYVFKVSEEDARNIIENWKSLRGRLECVRKLKNVEFYNDTASVSFTSTLAAVNAIGGDKNVVLIFGGVDRGDNQDDLYKKLSHSVHTVVLIPGSGTMKIRKTIQSIEKIEVHSAPSIEEAVNIAIEKAQKGDRILFSPGFAAGGVDRSRKERGERFVKAVKGL